MALILIYRHKSGVTATFTPAKKSIDTVFDGEIVSYLNSQINIIRANGGVNVQTVDDSKIPNRIFRNAWAVGSGEVVVDMQKARVIQMDKIRVHRAREFVKLDIIRLDGEDANDAAALSAAKAKRLAFKDLPQSSDEATAIAAAATPEILDAIWPTALLGERPSDI